MLKKYFALLSSAFSLPGQARSLRTKLISSTTRLPTSVSRAFPLCRGNIIFRQDSRFSVAHLPSGVYDVLIGTFGGWAVWRRYLPSGVYEVWIRIKNHLSDTYSQNHQFLFLKQLVLNPKQVSALTPASPALADCMARRLGRDIADQQGDIIELGAGTGNITHAVLARGVAPERLHLVEINPDFVEVLKRKFPTSNIYQCGAEKVDDLPTGQVDNIVSGLPLVSFSKEMQFDILSAAFKMLKPGGQYIQFTYSWRPSIHPDLQEKLNLHWTKSKRVWRSLPPASVYVFAQKQPTKNGTA